MERMLWRERIVRLRGRNGLHRLHGDGTEAELPCIAKKLATCAELELVVEDGIHRGMKLRD
jgi:hypothetical protein